MSGRKYADPTFARIAKEEAARKSDFLACTCGLLEVWCQVHPEADPFQKQVCQLTSADLGMLLEGRRKDAGPDHFTSYLTGLEVAQAAPLPDLTPWMDPANRVQLVPVNRDVRPFFRRRAIGER